jgi:hypothetical protein
VNVASMAVDQCGTLQKGRRLAEGMVVKGLEGADLEDLEGAIQFSLWPGQATLPSPLFAAKGSRDLVGPSPFRGQCRCRGERRKKCPIRADVSHPLSVWLRCDVDWAGGES